MLLARLNIESVVTVLNDMHKMLIVISVPEDLALQASLIFDSDRIALRLEGVLLPMP